MDDYQVTIRALGEHSAIKSKCGKVLKDANYELEEDCRQARLQISKFEYQISEQNVLLEEMQIRNKSLEVDSENYNEGLDRALNQISNFLSARMSVDDLTKSVMEEDVLLKEKVSKLESQVCHLKSQLLGAEERISSYGNIQKRFDEYKSRAQGCKEHVSDLSMQFETQLNNLIRARELALKESIACSPNDTLVRKNKSLQEELERLARDNMDLRAEINDMKAEHIEKDQKIETLEKEVI